MISVCDVQDADIPQMLKLLNDNLPGYYFPQEDQVRDLRGHDDSIMLHVDNAAYVLCCVELGLCDIAYLAVAPEHRRKGYGAALLDAVIQRHPGDIILTVRADNEAARALYASRGFQRYRHFPATGSLILKLTR